MHIDYKNELEKIEALLVKKRYGTIIKEVGWLFEISLKDLYKQQINFFERNINNPILKQEYDKLLEKQSKLYPNFNISREPFSSISWLFHQTNFNNLIELRINTPLTFSNKIPWSEIRKLRNLVTHTESNNIDRHTAYKFIDYIKTYILETKLSEEIILVGELQCYECEELIDKTWKYCPNCGVDLSSHCKKCGNHLKAGWKTCPKCETPRDGIKVEKPKLVYKHYCQAVWSDGYLSEEELIFLVKKRNELGLDIKSAEKIESKYAPINAIRFRDAVEGCLVDNKIDKAEKEHLKIKANDLLISHDLANSIYLACINNKVKHPLFEM